MMSFMFFRPDDGAATSRLGEVTAVPMGVKAVKMSNGGFGPVIALTALALPAMESV